MTEEKKDNLGTSDPALKSLYILLLRVNQLASSASFLTLALLDELEEKGIVQKENIDRRAREQGYLVINQLEMICSKLEQELEDSMT